MEARRVAIAVANYGVQIRRARLVVIGGAHLALARSQQLSADELIEVAIEHALSIADLDIGAVIFDHRVRMEHI
jgi:energy-converting hydrogenase Eha subunit H